RTRRFKRFIRSITYLIPRQKSLYRLCKLYIDNVNGDNNADMHINGELRFLRQAVSRSRSSVVFDVGANRGQWTLAVLAVNPQAQVHCFEPSSATFEKLLLNKWPTNVICNHCGLGARAGELILNIHYAGSELNSIYDDPERSALQTE